MTFVWASASGISVALLLAAAAFQAFISIGTTAYLAYGAPGKVLFFTERSDGGAFGKPPGEILAAEPGVGTYRRVVWLALAGFLGAFAVLEAGVAWYGVRAGAAWALGLLATSTVLLAAFWAAILAVYTARGAPLTLADVPPFMWLPTLLRVPALLLAGWGSGS